MEVVEYHVDACVGSQNIGEEVRIVPMSSPMTYSSLVTSDIMQQFSINIRIMLIVYVLVLYLLSNPSASGSVGNNMMVTYVHKSMDGYANVNTCADWIMVWSAKGFECVYLCVLTASNCLLHCDCTLLFEVEHCRCSPGVTHVHTTHTYIVTYVQHP